MEQEGEQSEIRYGREGVRFDESEYGKNRELGNGALVPVTLLILAI